MSLSELTAIDLISGLNKKEFSAEEVSAEYSAKIKANDSDLNNYLHFDDTDCLEQARMVDAKMARSESVGRLSGIPIAIKDVICVKDRITTCGSKILSEFVSPYDATVIQKIREFDGVILGKTNMDEFAMGSSNENSAFGPARNPWNLNHVTGGSSGGSAGCVAADLAPISLGSDTGGSVRQPAAFCGVTGLKPSYGRISRFGLVAFASSLDQIGIMARDVRDIALLLSETAGHDPNDSTSSPQSTADYIQNLSSDIKGMRIGVPAEYFEEGLDPEISAAFDSAKSELEKLGAVFVDLSLKTTKYGIAAYYLVASCEASGNLARYDGAHYGYRAPKEDNTSQNRSGNELLEMYRRTRSQGFGPEVKRRIMLGTYSLSSGYYDAYYLKALKTRRLIQNELNEAFANVDVIFGPTTPTPAYRIGERTTDPLSMYLGDIYTVVANLAGIPAISFPAGITKNGLPIGLQFQAPAFEEQRLLNVTRAFQQHTDWHTRRPELTKKD